MTQNGFSWRVLAVDDDPDKLDEIERILGSRMGDNQFIVTKCTSFAEGLNLIEDSRIDLVFLDVHDENGDPEPSSEPAVEDQEGENLLRRLQSSRFIPVIFYTGYPSKVEHLESMVVRVVGKGETTAKFRGVVSEVLETKLPHLLRYVEEQSRSYIWESLSDLIGKHKDSINSPDISLLLARKLAGSLSQNVVKEIIGMDTSKINPLEMYQYPPIMGSCNPADIYKRKSDKSLWMVFTPACDFEQNNAENVLLARITPLIEHKDYSNWIEKASNYEKMGENEQGRKEARTEMNKAKGEVKKLVKDMKKQRYKFLPGTFFIPDTVIDFQELINFPKSNDDDFEVICSLDNPYREEILQLFSKYYGRIGTPDYDKDPIWEKIEENFKTG